MLALRTYLDTCVNTGHCKQALKLLLQGRGKYIKSLVDIKHYNVVLGNLCRNGKAEDISVLRMQMIRDCIEPDLESYSYLLLACSRVAEHDRTAIKKILNTVSVENYDLKDIFTCAYFSPRERSVIQDVIRTTIDPKFIPRFCDQPISSDHKLLEPLKTLRPTPNKIINFIDRSQLELGAEQQHKIEMEASIKLKSIFSTTKIKRDEEKYQKIWNQLIVMWRESISKALDTQLEELKKQFLSSNKIHLYPFIRSIEKNLLVKLMLEEVELNAVASNFSLSTTRLHQAFGQKVMNHYFRVKNQNRGLLEEQHKIYASYLSEYCTNPTLMGSMTPREFIQEKANETENYAIYKDIYDQEYDWPVHIVASIGKFLYGIILREIKFDPHVVRNTKLGIKESRMVNAFYTAYLQISNSVKIKEEFRANQEFEALHQRSCYRALKFNCTFLPSTSPPMPWVTPKLGGHISNPCELIRPTSENLVPIDKTYKKLYPTFDSLNYLGLCPWKVNKDILNIVIKIYRDGGDLKLGIPLHESKMDKSAPILRDPDSKAERLVYRREKRKFDQSKREMYSLWRDCLYRLTIAHHYRNRIFWFPHNIDFRGRAYPIPPHFNHLGADLARSLLLFAQGRPLGPKGLDWLKIHLINLVGNMKRASLKERLDYADSILHSNILDSADHPMDGHRWWMESEKPWQVLSCCMDIARATRSKDPKKYVSHIPIHQDGSCNGLQHYAALGRDQNGGAAVNLVPSERPQDVYSEVVKIVEDIRSREAKNGVDIAKPLEGFVVRKVIKQTVMTTVYGVTQFGARAQIARQLENMNFPEKQVWPAALYLTRNTFKSIGTMFEKSRLIQDWLTSCAGIIAVRFKQPVKWETPIGLTVVQPYVQSIYKIGSSRLMGPSLCHGGVLPRLDGNKINSGKHRTAFPPNYIHSLDSTHMMLTSLYCQREGITYASVHDCYWTHAETVDKMNKICREQFVAMHQEPLMQNLSELFLKNYAEHMNFFEDTSQNQCDGSSENMRQTEQELGNAIESTSSSDSGLSMDDDLVRVHGILDLGLEDEWPADNRRLTKEDKIKLSIEKREREYLEQMRNIHETFRQVPATGELDLKSVMESTYFFS